MAEVEPTRPDKGQSKGATKEDQAQHRGKHGDTGEHAKKSRTERAPVADEGLGMSKYDSTRKS